MRPSLSPSFAFLLCIAFAARAEPVSIDASPQPPVAQDRKVDSAGEVAPAGAKTLSLRARIDRDAIRAAIAATPEEADPYPRRHEADTLSATPGEKFSKEFAEARLPDCLHSEGLKNQPTFFLSGFIALPFIAVAKLRGVCR